MELHDLLKSGRISSGLTTRQVAEKLKIDQALVSKFENGLRRPTRDQVVHISRLYNTNENEALLAWLTQKLLTIISGETLGLKALKTAEAKLGQTPDKEVENRFQKLLDEMEALKGMLGKE